MHDTYTRPETGAFVIYQSCGIECEVLNKIEE